jgi:putative DNA primase/helicase
LVFYQGDFYEWRGTHYHLISAAAVRTELYAFLKNAKVMVWIKDEAGERMEKKPFRPDNRAVDKIMDALKHSKDKAFISDEIHAPAWLHGALTRPDAAKVIALGNGILDLETRKLLRHTKDFFSMNALPFDFDENATCPRWQQFVAELYPNCAAGEGTRREFQKAVGYLVSSDRSQQKIFLVIGPKRSGKGTIGRSMRTDMTRG